MKKIISLFIIVILSTVMLFGCAPDNKNQLDRIEEKYNFLLKELEECMEYLSDAYPEGHQEQNCLEVDDFVFGTLEVEGNTYSVLYCEDCEKLYFLSLE